ncbi:Uncharacterized protein PECH_001570 [Penicillium ucsense]|uniref:Rhodopsin domain-containing protein n=1 Tax=Penicillium ucsense TaxID=2839758 RepID=A0A8J8VXA4_9EURO|nr:Uncharacterized protein PECM_001078 [Penicillium ucsense]KAF7732642.1 Uncharacterized protein PECH_001570 [Penicillium ucsense]
MGWVHNASPEVEALSQYREILGVCLSLTFLMVITVCLRLWLRAQSGRLGAADYVMVFSMIFSIIYSALCIAQSRYGLGLPLKLRPALDKAVYTKINYAGRPFYQLGIAGFKASLCLSYLRLISGTSMKLYRILIWTVIALSTLGHMAGALVLILNCTPVRSAWDITVHGHCLPVGPTFYGLAIFTIVCDVVMVFLPVPLLLRLKIKPAQKAGVVCLFLLGLFTTICSILRLSQIHRVAWGDGNSTMLVLWGTIEFNIGNIVTCIPYLTPLLRGFVRDFRSTSNKKYYNSHGRTYAMETWSKDQRSQLQSSASGPAAPRRSPSEELILSSKEPVHGGIEMTVEYSVSLEKENRGYSPR